MAGIDPPKNLLSLIRDFASEKSQGERRVVGLKKQIEELRSELEAANSELEEAKRLKETTEQELKGFEVELALNEASIQALEARIALIQDEVSNVGSEIEELKKQHQEEGHKFVKEATEIASINIKDQFTHVVSQIANEEEEYLAEQNIQKQLQLELIDIERKVYLMDVITREAKALENFTRYPNQI
ncbi:cingulin-like [Gossypium australe]|uniref:Cingulin-like n=1 Tax=Gossypium australe TaxID=47621 RepID=A0A5B6USD8_9ROSI|nr:cingulin-like [Gossypium australe]